MLRLLSSRPISPCPDNTWNLPILNDCRKWFYCSGLSSATGFNICLITKTHKYTHSSSWCPPKAILAFQYHLWFPKTIAFILSLCLNGYLSLSPDNLCFFRTTQKIPVSLPWPRCPCVASYTPCPCKAQYLHIPIASHSLPSSTNLPNYNTWQVSYISLSLIRTGFQFATMESTVLSVLVLVETSSIFLEISVFTIYFPTDKSLEEIFIRNSAYWGLETFFTLLSIYLYYIYASY